MKIKIGKYTNYFGPYHLAELLCFWVKESDEDCAGCTLKSKPEWVHKFGEFLKYGNIKPKPKPGEVYSLFDDSRKITILAKFLEWIESKKQRKVKIHIDNYDVYSMDHTLAMIILPMLKLLKENKKGSPIVDFEDVPEELGSKKEELDDDYENIDARWEYVLDAMIWSFEQLLDDNWEDQFYSERVDDFKLEKLENGCSKFVNREKSAFDIDGFTEYNNKIQYGLTMFGKYYRALWT